MKFLAKSSVLGAGVAAAAALADHLHKVCMIRVFAEDGRHTIEVAPFLDLVLVWNRGISYGLFRQDSEVGRWALTLFALAVCFALAAWLAKIETRLPAISVGLIIGGALGNAIDRIQFGAVADFFSFHAGGFHWYVFNLADVFIASGVAGLLYDSLTSSHKSAGNHV